MSVDTTLREMIREELSAELRRRGLDAVAIRYSSSNLPPELATKKDGTRTFNRVCRSGVVKLAEKIGREWQCDAAAWRDARRKPRRSAITIPARDDDDALAEAAVAGLRGRATR